VIWLGNEKKLLGSICSGGKMYPDAALNSGKIFISYSRKDSEIIDRLIRKLKQAGYQEEKIWIDRSEIRGGELWRKEIVGAIKGADVVILAISDNSIASQNVRKELDLSDEYKKRILPILVRKTSLPLEDIEYQIAGVQKIDFTDDFDRGFSQLLAALGSKSGIRPSQARLPSPFSQRNKLLLIGLAAGVVLLLIAVCVFLVIRVLPYIYMSTPTPLPPTTQALPSFTQAPASTTQAIPNAHDTQVAATRTEDASNIAHQATGAAATSTVIWLAGDDDIDGLTNQEEKSLGLLTNNRDSDGDGLSDGNEVKTYNTKPTVEDSDEDGLKDGEEITRGLNPNDPDTDLDGQRDNVDPDPLYTPTLPPSPQITTLVIKANLDRWWPGPSSATTECMEGQICQSPTPDQRGHDNTLVLYWDYSTQDETPSPFPLIDLHGSGLLVLGFDFGLIPQGARLNQATLLLYAEDSDGGPGELLIQRAIDPWDESGVSTPKCSEDQIIVQSPGHGRHRLDVTAIAQSLYTNNPVGYGICIKGYSGSDMTRVFTSREGPDAQQPRLEVIYEK